MSCCSLDGGLVFCSEQLENIFEFELRREGWGHQPPLPPPVALLLRRYHFRESAEEAGVKGVNAANQLHSFADKCDEGVLTSDVLKDWEHYANVDCVAALHRTAYAGSRDMPPDRDEIEEVLRRFEMLGQ